MKNSLSLFIVSIIFLFFSGVASAGEVDYCGELQLDIGGIYSISFHLVNTGGPFFIVHGIIVPTPIPCSTPCDPNACNPDYKPIMLSGTGQVVNLDVEGESHPVFFANFAFSQEHAQKCEYDCWRDARIAQLSLDLTPNDDGDVTGRIWTLGIDYNSCDFGGPRYSENYNEVEIMLEGKLPNCLRKKK